MILSCILILRSAIVIAVADIRTGVAVVDAVSTIYESFVEMYMSREIFFVNSLKSLVFSITL